MDPNHIKEHLVATTILQLDALLKYGFIDVKQHETILGCLPNASTNVSPVHSVTHKLPGAVPVIPSAGSSLRKTVVGLGGNNNTATHSLIISSNPIRVAVKDFQTGVDGDLSFKVGDLIEVLEEVDENWMSGSLNGKIGIFPTNFTEPKVVLKPKPSSQRPILPLSPKPITASLISNGPPQPPPLSSKPINRIAMSNRPSVAGSIASMGSTTSLTPVPQPTEQSNQQFFYLRSKANGNVLGVEMGLTSMVTHDSPILVVPLTSKSTEPLLLRMDETSCLITPSNLAVDVRVGEWTNGGTVVLAKRVATSIGEGLHQRWEISSDGAVRSERGFMLVEDYGRAVVWESDADLEDQRWDLKLQLPLPRRSKIILFATLTIATCLATIYLIFGETLLLPVETNIAQVCNDHSPDCIITHRTQSSTSNSTSLKPKVLYYNTHGGAGENMEGVMSRLDIQLDFFNPKQITGYGMSAKRAQHLIRNGHVDFVCGLYDVIIIGDTIPHGRALMQSLLEKDPAKRCKSKIVVEMTNRFDWDVKDKKAYYKMWKELIKRSEKDLKGKIVWVANNNVEQAYMEFKLRYMAPKAFRVLRPIGIAKDHEYPEDLENPDFSNFAARTHDTTHIFDDMKMKHNIPLTIFPFGHKYGGPKNLLRFKGFVDIPYQYSVMKFYENIAYGVPTFVPTPYFYEYLVNNKQHFTHCIHLNILQQLPTADQIEERAMKPIRDFPEWSGYMDYYDPVFAPFVYYFNNWDELREAAMKQKVKEVDWKRVRVFGPLFYAGYRKKILEGWASLFHDDLGFSGVNASSLAIMVE
ncbi:UNVERIFIED_CONTAM: hypothetical protein HDU68_012000 [Siphonaria sp. JEL0065]|nr:hypothetical protein HDU68_012000 [Siphonaria sp. JEL0065]